MAGVLFPESTHRIAEASQEAFAFVCLDLQQREIHTFKLVARYIRETGWPNVTGGELAQFSGEDKTTLRPRLTNLCKRKGWLNSHAMRESRAPGERRCHPYSLAISEAAIERIGQ